MNNYEIRGDYYNYDNNNYNLPNYTTQASPNNLYDPYAGFIRGNMFPELYNTYKVNQPFEIRPMNNQAELLTYIDALSFAAHDLNLYLDNFPTDRTAIQLFNQYRTQADKMMKDYQTQYGPLLVNSDASNAYPWAWNQSPWPWENK